jgi:hypothetical protein
MNLAAGIRGQRFPGEMWLIRLAIVHPRSIDREGLLVTSFEEYDMPGIKMENGIASAGGAKQPQFVLVNNNFELPDLLGAAYEHLIKFFADSAGK